MFLDVALAVALGSGGCNQIRADHIYGRDLAAAVSVLKALPAETSYSLSPTPGQRRVFRSNELTRIARAASITEPVDQDVCFEWVRKPLDVQAIVDAMKRSLAGLNATVDLVEPPSVPVPDGVIDFPLAGLSGSSAGPVVWRGTLVYAGNKILPLWARVRVSVKQSRVIAAATLKPGQPISAADLRTEEYAGPYQREKKYSDPQQVIELMPKVTIAEGTSLSEALLRPVNDVERGDLVQVVVQIENARVEAQGIAEDGGVRGTSVTIRNPKSGRKFRARIESRDRVVVLPGGVTGLAVEESKS